MAKIVTMAVKESADLQRAGKIQYPREGREQVTEKFVRWATESGMQKEPSFPVGEYLGDIEVTDEMLDGLTNINPHVNSIDQVKRGRFVVYADFDWSGDGHFIGLRLEPLRDESSSKRGLATAASHIGQPGMTGTFGQGGE